MRSFICIAVILTAVLAAAPVSADRIILAPTGNVLAPGVVKAEGAVNPDDTSSRIYWVGMGMQRFELNATRFQISDSTLPETGSLIDQITAGKTTDVIGLEFSLMPETSLTPGFGVGVWDFTGKTSFGKGYYLAMSKSVPLLKELPLPIHDVQVHAGYGINGIDGLFGGAQASLPLGIKLYAEYFQEDINYAVGWNPAPTLQLKFQSIDGEAFYGLQFAPPL
jgi:hypothetical protein